MAKTIEQRLQELEVENEALKKSGRIIETVINSNGTAIKFTDGTLICYMSKQCTTGATYGDVLVHFPCQFKEVPAVTATPRARRKLRYSTTYN